jgi:hypothetical protein
VRSCVLSESALQLDQKQRLINPRGAELAELSHGQISAANLIAATTSYLLRCRRLRTTIRAPWRTAAQSPAREPTGPSTAPSGSPRCGPSSHLGLVGAWRLMRVCRAARVGAKEFLSTLPGLVVCGGYSTGGGGARDDVWRLDLGTLRWEPMPGLVTGRSRHACCAVRGKLVVLGGVTSAGGLTSSVEMLSYEEGEGAFVDLPPLSCGAIRGAAAIAVEESDSAAGQVLLLGGYVQGGAVPTVHLVDLATGVCTPGRPEMLHSRYDFAAAWLPDGRIVCAGGWSGGSSAEMRGPPV